MSETAHRPPPLLRHKILLGDWTRAIRDPIDLIRATYLVGLVVVAYTGNISAFARLAVTAGFVYLARWIELPRPFDLGFVLAMALQGWGNVFGLFDRFGWYDTVVHLTLSLFVAPLFYIGLARLEVVPDPGKGVARHKLIGLWIVTLSLGLAFGGLYEIYEWTVDHVLGATLAIGETDTVSDLTMDALGSGLGGLLPVVWATYGWASTRRAPARRLL
jgi:hypothetical protein